MTEANQTYSRRMAEAWARCADFNDRVGYGTSVRYWIADREEPIETTTRSEAYVHANGTVVVLVEGESDGVKLDQIETID